MKYLSLTVNGAEVKVAFDENSVHIYNAYPIKDELKLRGYRWNPDEKSWYNDRNDVENELSVLKNNLIENVDETKTIINNDKPNDSEIPKSSSVSELKNRIQSIISNSMGGYIWVRGIISSEVKNYAWASYFDLMDEDEAKDIYFSSEIKTSQLSSINFKLQQSGVADELCKDLPVLLLVGVNLSYKKNIDIRLTVIDILPEYTREKIKSKRDVTVDRLKSEGVFDNQRKLSLPFLVRRIGLISSEQGTSIKDIDSGMGKYRNKYGIYFIDARMEGDNGVKSIVNAIEYFENIKEDIDLIVIARGGGSEQSLSMFNDYELCLKVCKTDIPVLTAIGHEKDLSAIELCSYVTPTPSTPSGIGKYLYDRFSKIQDDLSELFVKLYHLSSNLLKDNRFAVLNKISKISLINKRFIGNGIAKIEDKVKNAFSRANSILQKNEYEIKTISGKVEPLRLISVLDEKREKIIKSSRYITDSAKRILRIREDILKEKNNLIKASDPRKILKRGFVMTLDTKGKIISSKEKFKEKEAVLRFYDGDVKIMRSKEDE